MSPIFRSHQNFLKTYVRFQLFVQIELENGISHLISEMA